MPGHSIRSGSSDDDGIPITSTISSVKQDVCLPAQGSPSGDNEVVGKSARRGASHDRQKRQLEQRECKSKSRSHKSSPGNSGITVILPRPWQEQGKVHVENKRAYMFLG